MTTITDPVIDRWYKDLENNYMFKVVAIDEDEDTIDVQYHSGEIGEYDRESWYGSTFDYIEEPEDWSAPFEVEEDDLGYSDPDDHRNNGDTLNFEDYLE